MGPLLAGADGEEDSVSALPRPEPLVSTAALRLLAVGRITYRKGGYWRPEADDAGPHTPKSTLHALVARGLARWERGTVYTFEASAVAITDAGREAVAKMGGEHG